ncbi:exosortase [Thalassotalea ponticola]|uniref:exosortase n=1 Tax=Thalassotalea ponticola TaxID=1523392 RepID=UPI0025B49197|nr:exosortase [Thalassotalea ponticola]MDN3652411.1 exosortase [Thalassotalea ponticola]
MKTFRVTPLIVIATVYVIAALLNVQIITTIWRHSFDDGSYSHAYLIPFICAFLFWRLYQRGELIGRTKLSVTVIGYFVLASLLLFVSVRAQLSLAYWIALLLLCSSAILLFLRANLALVAATLYPIYLLPVWGSLTNLLQFISVSAVEVMMSFSGIAFYVEEQYVTIPAGVFHIANGCSGLRYLLVSLAITHLYVLLYLRHWSSAIKFISVAIAGALVTNWIRITALILIGEYTQMTSPLMKDHNNFGWYLYIPFLFLLFAYGNYLERKLPVADAKEENCGSSIAIKARAIVVCVLGLSLSSSWLATAHKSNQVYTNIETLPAPTIKFYSSINHTSSTDRPSDISEYRIWFDCKELDCKPDFYLNNMVPEGWQVLRHDRTGEANYLLVAKGRQRAQITYTYQYGDTTVDNLMALKLSRLSGVFRTDQQTSIAWRMVDCDIGSCANSKGGFDGNIR